jgi:hypothetical protein
MMNAVTAGNAWASGRCCLQISLLEPLFTVEIRRQRRSLTLLQLQTSPPLLHTMRFDKITKEKVSLRKLQEGT